MNASIVIKRRLPGGQKATMAEFEDIETRFALDDFKAFIKRTAEEWAERSEPVPRWIKTKAAAYGAFLDAAGELDDALEALVTIICRVESPAQVFNMEGPDHVGFDSAARASS